MALKIKAKEKKLKFSKDGPEVYRYVMVPDLYSTLDSEKVIKEAAIRSGVSEGVMQACWKGAGEVIKAWATEGHSVALPGLGNMRFGLSAKAESHPYPSHRVHPDGSAEGGVGQYGHQHHLLRPQW